MGDWASVYKVVAITRLLVAPHHTIHDTTVWWSPPHTTHVAPYTPVWHQSDRGADQCNDSGAARPLSALPPFPPPALLPSDATGDPPSPWTSHLFLPFFSESFQENILFPEQYHIAMDAGWLNLTTKFYSANSFLASAARRMVWFQRPMKENPKKRPSVPPSSAT